MGVMQTSVTQAPEKIRLEALLGCKACSAQREHDADRFRYGLAFTLAHRTSVCAGSVTGRLHRAQWTEDPTALCRDPSPFTVLVVT